MNRIEIDYDDGLIKLEIALSEDSLLDAHALMTESRRKFHAHAIQLEQILNEMAEKAGDMAEMERIALLGQLLDIAVKLPNEQDTESNAN